MVAAPLGAEELLARSDLAGTARVLRCDGLYATLRFTKLRKGRPRGGVLAWLGLRRQAVVRLEAVSLGVTAEGAPTPTLGSWTDTDAYRPGSLVATHLVWNESYRAYQTVWWNGVTRVASR